MAGVEYRFGLSATRGIAGHRDDAQRLGVIAGGVLGAKALLAYKDGIEVMKEEAID